MLCLPDIQQAVFDLVQDAAIVCPPVLIGLISPLCDAVVEWGPLRKGLDGVLMVGSSLHLIWLSPLLNSTRARFTAAHELGHLLLHAGTEEHIFLTQGQADPEKGEQEREANRFAAELLMPAQLLEAEWRRCPDFDFLRDRFWVSKQALSRRLSDLGLEAHRMDAPSVLAPCDCRVMQGSSRDRYMSYLVQRHREDARARKRDNPCHTSPPMKRVVAASPLP